MPDENSWEQIAMSLDAVRERLIDGTHGVLAESDSVTVRTNIWVATVIELRRIQKQCVPHGKMHCPQVSSMSEGEIQFPERCGSRG